MRLPSDAALIVIDAERVISDPRNGAIVGAAIGLLVQAWRKESLPVAHVRRTSSPVDGRAYLPEAQPLPGEAMLAMTGADAFAGGALEAWLDEAGATTLVLSGFGDPGPVETSLEAGAALGYRLFAVAEACAAPLHEMPPEIVRVVTLQTALQAAALAQFRRKWRARGG
jgi:nicotinamidase-related amidase